MAEKPSKGVGGGNNKRFGKRIKVTSIGKGKGSRIRKKRHKKNGKKLYRRQG